MKLERFERAAALLALAAVCTAVGFFAGRMSVQSTVAFAYTPTDEALFSAVDPEKLDAVFKTDEPGSLPAADAVSGIRAADASTAAAQPSTDSTGQTEGVGAGTAASMPADTENAASEAPKSSAQTPDTSSLHNNSKLVNINTATQSELESLPGIGAVLAGRIIADRQKNGHFSAPSDIMRVAGIKEGKYEKIKLLITVQ